MECEAGGVEELAVEVQVAGDAVGRVACNRQSDRLQVDADLVRPPRLQLDVEKRMVSQQFSHLEVRDRFARRVRVEGVAGAIGSIPSDRRPEIPRPLGDAILAAMAKAPADRPQTATAYAELVRAAAGA